ncbi:TlpA family protein disulfide reductase [Nannocystaceae bacterium ST9]
MLNRRLASSLVVLLSLGCDEGGGSTADDDVAEDESDAGSESEAAGTDATDATDTTGGEPTCDVPSPYMGGWDIGCCQDEVVSTAWYPGGVGPGAVIPDWTFIDQFGESLRVRDFCHEAIYFDYAAMWCAACQVHAPELESLYLTYADRGLLALTYMSESNDSGPATQADVQAWTSTYALTGVVAYSTLQDVWYPFGVDQGGGSFSISLPGTMLLAPGGVIAKIGVPTIEEIEAVLPGE